MNPAGQRRGSRQGTDHRHLHHTQDAAERLHAEGFLNHQHQQRAQAAEAQPIHDDAAPHGRDGARQRHDYQPHGLEGHRHGAGAARGPAFAGAPEGEFRADAHGCDHGQSGGGQHRREAVLGKVLAELGQYPLVGKGGAEQPAQHQPEAAAAQRLPQGHAAARQAARGLHRSGAAGRPHLPRHQRLVFADRDQGHQRQQQEQQAECQVTPLPAAQRDHRRGQGRHGQAADVVAGGHRPHHPAAGGGKPQPHQLAGGQGGGPRKAGVHQRAEQIPVPQRVDQRPQQEAGGHQQQ